MSLWGAELRALSICLRPQIADALTGVCDIPRDSESSERVVFVVVCLIAVPQACSGRLRDVGGGLTDDALTRTITFGHSWCQRYPGDDSTNRPPSGALRDGAVNTRGSVQADRRAARPGMAQSTLGARVRRSTHDIGSTQSYDSQFQSDPRDRRPMSA